MDIQMVHIDSEDTILCQINENLRPSDYKIIMEQFKKVFPNNNILFTNNKSIEKIIVLKRNNLLEDILNKPLEELYPELFNKGIEL